jgi:hypothetical protein
MAWCLIEHRDSFTFSLLFAWLTACEGLLSVSTWRQLQVTFTFMQVIAWVIGKNASWRRSDGKLRQDLLSEFMISNLELIKVN